MDSVIEMRRKKFMDELESKLIDEAIRYSRVGLKPVITIEQILAAEAAKKKENK